MAVSSKAARQKKVKIDLNLLPEEYQKRVHLGPGHVLLFLIVLGLIFNIVLFRAKSEIAGQVSLLNKQFRTAQTQTRNLAEQGNQAKELLAQIEKNKSLLNQKKQDFDAFQSQKISWPVIVEAVTYTPDISLSSFSQKDKGIIIKGSARDVASIESYISFLTSRDLFSEIFLDAELKPGAEIAFSLDLEIKTGGGQ